MRCLLVDDNEEFAATARRVLDQDGVMITGSAANIAEALRRADEMRPDVVLIDVALGEESGFDLARRLARSHPRDLAIIMISSDAEDNYADLVAESPAVGFLPKAKLSADAIRRLLRKPG